MELSLSEAEVRVLGSLIEKAITTPDYYPLSLNALMLACNQSSNRDPVVAYDEAMVGRTLDSLRQRSLVRSAQGIESRVAKFRHLAYEALSVDGRELAVLCVLLLRGAQTAGEIKTRTARLTTFASLSEVEDTLNGLISRDPAPLVARLPRQPGQKEVRYVQLLSAPEGAVAELVSTERATADHATSARATTEHDSSAPATEHAVAELRKEVAELRVMVEELRSRFL